MIVSAFDQTQSLNPKDSKVWKLFQDWKKYFAFPESLAFMMMQLARMCMVFFYSYNVFMMYILLAALDVLNMYVSWLELLRGTPSLALKQR